MISLASNNIPTTFVHACLGQAKSFKLLYQKDKKGNWLDKHKNVVNLAKQCYLQVGTFEQILIKEGEAEVAELSEDWNTMSAIWNGILEERDLYVKYKARAKEHLARGLMKLQKLDEACKEAKRL